MERFEHEGVCYALIARSPRPESRVQFFTPDDAPLQLGAFDLAKGAEIPPHLHKPFERTLMHTSEVLVIQAGRLAVDFYDENRRLLGERILDAGDVIILLAGGHGFRVLEPLKMLEIKQGPYAGEDDKIRFKRP